MAQAGYTPIQLYYSTTTTNAPAAANLLDGELAINITDGKLFYKDNGGNVQVIAYKNVPLSTVTGSLAIANGGTGSTTAQAAINALAGAVTVGQYLRGNGTNVVMSAIQAADVPTLNQNTTGTAANVTGIVAVANGGTGASSAANARTNLGATTLGSNIFTITNPSAITFPRFNADNTVSALSAADFRTAIGAGTGGGSVSSVDTGSGLTGGPITTTGTVSVATNGISDALFRQSAAYAVVGRSASTTGNVADITAANDHQVLRRSGTSIGFGAIALNQSGAVTGTLAVANGGTGATTFTAGTYLKGNGTSAISAQSGIPAGDITSGTLGVARGGTGATTLTGVVIGNGTSAFTVKTNPSGAFVGTTDTQTLTNKTVEAGTFTNGYTEEVATANTGTAYTIDLANGSVQILTLTGNCTFTFPTATAGRGFTLLLKQDATGSRTATWPAAVKWPGGTAPTITSTASRADKYVFVADGTSWVGSNAGQNYAL